MRFHFGSRRYTEADLEPGRIAAQQLIEIPGEGLTPGQQLALLTIRKSDLADRLVQKLQRGTVRPSGPDYQALATLGYAMADARRLHAITPRGQWKADEMARHLAKQMNVPLRTQWESRQANKWTRQASRAGW